MSRFRSLWYRHAEITAAKLIAYTPFIKNTVEREEWEDFSAGHATWVVDGHSFYPDSEEQSPN
jgi:hypothetical protein